MVTIKGYRVPKTSGVLYNYDEIKGPNGTVTVSATQLPVIVNKDVAYGGIQTADGSVLTFRATRDAN